jgi:hypothetical protein
VAIISSEVGLKIPNVPKLPVFSFLLSPILSINLPSEVGRPARAGRVKQGGGGANSSVPAVAGFLPDPPPHGSVLPGPVAESSSLAPRVPRFAEPIACLPCFLVSGPHNPGRLRKKGSIAHRPDSRTHPLRFGPVSPHARGQKRFERSRSRGISCPPGAWGRTGLLQEGTTRCSPRLWPRSPWPGASVRA